VSRATKAAGVIVIVDNPTRAIPIKVAISEKAVKIDDERALARSLRLSAAGKDEWADSVYPNPSVRRRLARLRTKFDAENHKQRQKYERELRDAAETGRRYGVGDVVGIYAAKCSDNGAVWGGVIMVVLLVFGLFFVGGGGTAIALIQSLWLTHPARLIGFIATLVALLLLSLWLKRQQPSYAWLYAYTDGLVGARRGGGPPDLIRWDAVESLYNVWQDVFNPVSEAFEPRFVGYRLRLVDGREQTFPLSYRNMLDPYAEIGPILATILPAPVAQTLPSHPTLGQVLERTIVRRKLPEALRAFRGGRPVDFGDLRLDARGLGTQQGRNTLAWGDVRSIAPEKNMIVVKRNGYHWAWHKFPITDMPNAAVLFALLAETGAGQAPHAQHA